MAAGGSVMVQQQAVRDHDQAMRNFFAGTHKRQTRARVARMKSMEARRRKDWAEKASTDIARRFDVIVVEDLKIGSMTRSAKGTRQAPGRNVAAKAGLNREIGRSGWGLLVRRLQDKAPGISRRGTP